MRLLAMAGTRQSVPVLTELAGEPEPETQVVFAQLTGVATNGNPGHDDTSRLGGTGTIPRVLILPPMAQAQSRGIDMVALSLIDEITHTLSRARSFAVLAPHTARQVAAFMGVTAWALGFILGWIAGFIVLRAKARR